MIKNSRGFIFKALTVKSVANNTLHAWRVLPVPYCYSYGDVHFKTLIWLVNFNSWCTRLYRLLNKDSQRILKESGVRKMVITGERNCHTKYLLNPMKQIQAFLVKFKTCQPFLHQTLKLAEHHGLELGRVIRNQLNVPPRGRKVANEKNLLPPCSLLLLKLFHFSNMRSRGLIRAL